MKDFKDDYTFIIGEKSQTRFVAGKYDINKKQPNYTLEISAAPHVKEQVKVEQIIIGKDNNHSYCWDIKNESTWPVFVIVKRNNELLDIYGNIKE